MFDSYRSQFTKKRAKSLLVVLALVTLTSFLFGLAGGAISGFLVARSQEKILDQLRSQPDLLPAIINQEINETRIIKEEEPVVAVVKSASPSVVSIIVTKDLSKLYNQTGPFLFEEFFGFRAPQAPQGKQQVGGGTGFIISEDGLILTNKHVVADEEAEYTVITSDNQQYKLKILGKDQFIDIAIGKIEATNLKSISLGDSDKIEIGQSVIAVGNALSEYRNTVTKGVISGRGRRVVAGGGLSQEVLEEALQTDAAINPGNSGGPLLNLKGQVIGINTAVSREGQLIGFAIPINAAKPVIESVKKTGKIIRPFLGIRFIIINQELAERNNLQVNYGALIIRGSRTDEVAITPGSPADKAGLQENDIILEIDGKKVTEEMSIGSIIRAKKPGDQVALKVLHKGDEKVIEVVLEELKQ